MTIYERKSSIAHERKRRVPRLTAFYQTLVYFSRNEAMMRRFFKVLTILTFLNVILNFIFAIITEFTGIGTFLFYYIYPVALGFLASTKIGKKTILPMLLFAFACLLSQNWAILVVMKYAGIDIPFPVFMAWFNPFPLLVPLFLYLLTWIIFRKE